MFSLCFAVNTEVFGQIQVHSLKENGENLPVTHENKREYVELYVDFLLNKSVENQFKAFNQGFQKVRKILKIVMRCIIFYRLVLSSSFESDSIANNGVGN